MPAAAALDPADAALADIADEKTWIDESFKLAQSDVYMSPITNTDGPFTLTQAYKDNALKVANKRIALAGARLAKLLDAALK